MNDSQEKNLNRLRYPEGLPSTHAHFIDHFRLCESGSEHLSSTHTSYARILSSQNV